MLAARRARLLLLLLVVSCGAPPSEPAPALLGLYVRAPDRAVMEAYVRTLPLTVAVREREDPVAALAGAEDGIAVAVLRDLDCGECERIERSGEGAVVRGGGPLAMQVGVTRLLEAMGFRFHHPHRTMVPAALALPSDPALYDHTVSPERSVRGLQLHTLHPIEAHFDFWEPGDASLEGVRRTLDWVVRNRGNRLNWPAVDDIQRDPATLAAWREHTARIVAEAHLRGVRVSLGVQLFGLSNLQFAFDLIDSEPADDAAAMAEIDRRLDALDGLGIDGIQIAFGEFFGADPDVFVHTLELAYDVIRARFPDIEIGATIHVGDGPDQRVIYEGEELLYYFLALRADRDLVPWIHTVMYYDLFEDAGGAYSHEDFSEHRDALLARLAAGERVAYYPESAYWVAFDNSVPTYLPIYLLTRHLDLARIREASVSAGHADLDEHITFSSGWEWGYWQNDVACLRMSHTLPPTWGDVVREMLAPHGAAGDAAADAVVDLGELQHRHLLVGRLAAWLAGRDATFDLGDAMGIRSQPSRPQPAEILAMTGEERSALASSVQAPLEELATGTEAALASLRASGAPLEDPFVAELVDGFEVDLLRTRFAHAGLSALLVHAEGGDPSASLSELSALLDAARTVVARRHADLHDVDGGARLVARRRVNATLYDYGYLREADTLCYWEREQAQIRNAILDAGDTVPACVL